MSETEVTTATAPQILPQILPMTEQEMDNYRLHRRFDRMGRLVGDDGMKRLMDAHVMVIGLGGVGSFAVEALARSGVGRLTLVDFDEICITNFNRQLHALNGLVGEKKAEVLAERVRKINPAAKVEPVVNFYNERLADEILIGRPDLVIDCIDSITSKCHLLDNCLKKGIPVLTSMGTGGRMDPLKIRVADLARTHSDSLARSVRQILRSEYGFPEDKDYGITAVYSTETPRKPVELGYDGGKGFRCVCPQKDNEFFNCDNRNLIWGNASFVTGAFGLQLASLAVRRILGELEEETSAPC
jgi:tRNA A37 threonylcarbamoyladenosine dehydratase